MFEIKVTNFSTQRNKKNNKNYIIWKKKPDSMQKFHLKEKCVFLSVCIYHSWFSKKSYCFFIFYFCVYCIYFTGWLSHTHTEYTPTDNIIISIEIKKKKNNSIARKHQQYKRKIVRKPTHTASIQHSIPIKTVIFILINPKSILILYSTPRCFVYAAHTQHTHAENTY